MSPAGSEAGRWRWAREDSFEESSALSRERCQVALVGWGIAEAFQRFGREVVPSAVNRRTAQELQLNDELDGVAV